MASMTTGAVQTAFSAAAKILDQQRRYGYVNATNLISLLATYEADYGGDFIRSAETAIQQCRAANNGVLMPNYIQTVLRPWIQQYTLSAPLPTTVTNDAAMLQELYLYMQKNKIYMQSRNITYNPPTNFGNLAGGSNLGNGKILRLTRDQWNFPIENIWCDSKLARCVQDATTGAKQGQEVFSVQASVPYVDQIRRSGSGISAIFTGRTTDDTNPGLFNASFDNWSSTTGSPTNPSGLTNWVSSGGDSSSIYTLDATNYFRVAPSTNAANSYALNIVASNTFSQLLSVKGTRLNPGTPYVYALIFNAQVNGATGTLTGRMGKVFNTVTVDGLTGWQVMTVPATINGTVGQACWPKNFIADNPSTTDVEIVYNKTGGNGLLIAEALLLQMQPHDNTWYVAIPGSAATYAPWKLGDQLQWADVDGNTGVNQSMAWRAWNFYFPSSNGSSIGWADA